MTRATWIVAILCALAVIAGALGGPSDTEAAADTAADLRDAQQQASAEWRAELKHAQALALMSASGHK